MAESTPGLALFQRSYARLLQQFLDLERQHLPADVIDKQLMAIADGIVRDHNTSALIAGEIRLTDEDEREFRSNVRGLMGGGALVPLLDRDDVENIHILGHDKVVLSLADGSRIMGPPLAGSEEELVMMIRHLAATAGHTSRRFDTAAPILDLRLASGHRLFAVTAVAERTSVVIRRHRMLQSSLEQLEQKGTVTPEMIAVLRAAVRPPSPANMLVVGGTGAGKTTLLRSLLAEVPQFELIVTIEDTLELHLRSSGLHDRTLALETRTSNTEGMGEISMYDLCKAALRMSPDRVIVGEVRGGEVMQLLQAMGIGNDGSLGTIHAGSTQAAINKMLIYAQRSPDSPTPDSVLREIAQVLHLLVYIKKLPDGRRAITSIREIIGHGDGEAITSEVFAPGPDGIGVYVKPFNPDGEALARLMAAGFDPDVLGEPDHSRSDEPQSRPPTRSPQPATPQERPKPAAPQQRPPSPQHLPERPQPAATSTTSPARSTARPSDPSQPHLNNVPSVPSQPHLNARPSVPSQPHLNNILIRLCLSSRPTPNQIPSPTSARGHRPPGSLSGPWPRADPCLPPAPPPNGPDRPGWAPRPLSCWARWPVWACWSWFSASRSGRRASGRSG